jgi:UDP-3-O-[3-hydroxymyristoyl] glucosamine N-acyltransferase
MSLKELAVHADAELVGDGSKLISGVAQLDQAQADQLAFCTGSRYLKQLANSKAGAVVVKKEYAKHCRTAALIVDNPYFVYAKLATLLHPQPEIPAGIAPNAIVSGDAALEEGVSVGPGAHIEPGARVGADTKIGAGVFVGAGAVIGAGCRIAPGAYVGEGCRIGNNVILMPGVVIGADGFGFAPGEGRWQKVPQLGVVDIGDDVEIGANSTVDRGALGDTVIESGVKLDNLVHIAHNVRLGAHTVIAGCTVVAGSTTIGRHCVIGGQSAITGHIEIADGVTVMGMTSVTGSIKQAGVYSSPLPARPVNQWRKNAVRFTQLDDLFRRLSALERSVEALGAKSSGVQ